MRSWSFFLAIGAVVLSFSRSFFLAIGGPVVDLLFCFCSGESFFCFCSGASFAVSGFALEHPSEARQRSGDDETTFVHGVNAFSSRARA